MSLEERTLVIRNLNSQYVTRPLLEELFNQAGPVLNVVLRSDFAYIEFSHKCSVAYALALMEGIHLFGQELHLSPKACDESVYQYVNSMKAYNYAMACNPNFFEQYLPKDKVHQTVRHNSHESNAPTRQYERNNPYRREESSHSSEKRFRSTYSDYDRPSHHDSRQHNNHYDRRHTPHNSYRPPNRDYDQRMKPQQHYQHDSYR